MVIADIGTTCGEYVSFIIFDNYEGAYGIGQALVKAMKAKGWDKGTVGLVTISLAQKNGQAPDRWLPQTAAGGRHQGVGVVADEASRSPYLASTARRSAIIIAAVLFERLLSGRRSG